MNKDCGGCSDTLLFFCCCKNPFYKNYDRLLRITIANFLIFYPKKNQKGFKKLLEINFTRNHCTEIVGLRVKLNTIMKHL